MDFALGKLALTTGHYLWEFAEVAVLGFFVAGLLQAVIRPDALRRLVGGGVLRSNFAGATAGFFTPLCCCTAIPTAIELYRTTGRRPPSAAARPAGPDPVSCPTSFIVIGITKNQWVIVLPRHNV